MVLLVSAIYCFNPNTHWFGPDPLLINTIMLSKIILGILLDLIQLAGNFMETKLNTLVKLSPSANLNTKKRVILYPSRGGFGSTVQWFMDRIVIFNSINRDVCRNLLYSIRHRYQWLLENDIRYKSDALRAWKVERWPEGGFRQK